MFPGLLAKANPSQVTENSFRDNRRPRRSDEDGENKETIQLLSKMSASMLFAGAYVIMHK